MPVYLKHIVNFESGDSGKPVEVLRVGEFEDMNGMEVVIDINRIDQIVANFEKRASGQDVPIDIRHRRDEAAGWVKRIWREGKILMAEVNWNRLGKELVGEQIYRYLSASFDMLRNVLSSISLVNFPAVKGLRPVELQEMLAGTGEVALGAFLQARIHRAFTLIADEMAALGIVDVEQRKALSSAIGDALEAFAGSVGDVGEVMLPVSRVENVEYHFSEQDQEDVMLTEDEIRAQERERINAELAASAKKEAQLRESIRAEERELAEARFAKRAELQAFADEVCNAGLSVKPEEVVNLMSGLDDEQQTAMKTILQAKMVSFQERGSSLGGHAADDEPAELLKLPEEYAADLRSGEMTLADLCSSVFEDLGDLSLYDLSEFEGK